MLDWVTTIRQCTESFNRFGKPWVDPKTNQLYLDANESPKHFIPNHLWNKCLIKAPVALNGNPKIIVALKKAKDDHEVCQIKVAQHQKLLVKLESTKREDQLQAKFYRFAVTFTLGHIVTEQTNNGGSIQGNKLNRQEQSTKMAYDAISGHHQ